MALGAEPRDILKMVMRQSAIVVGAGLLIGLAIAFAGTSAIANFIVGIKPTDPGNVHHRRSWTDVRSAGGLLDSRSPRHPREPPDRPPPRLGMRVG